MPGGGVTLVGGAAQFPKLASPMYPNVFISDVLHQATVAIDEKGTEACAATAIVFGDISAAIDTPTPPLSGSGRLPFVRGATAQFLNVTRRVLDRRARPPHPASRRAFGSRAVRTFALGKK